jgi:hypothetical protein
MDGTLEGVPPPKPPVYAGECGTLVQHTDVV